MVTGTSQGSGKAISHVLLQHGGQVYGMIWCHELMSIILLEIDESCVVVPIDIADATEVNVWIRDTFANPPVPERLKLYAVPTWDGVYV